MDYIKGFQITIEKIERIIKTLVMAAPALLGASAGNTALDLDDYRIKAHHDNLNYKDRSKKNNGHEFIGRHLIVTYYDCDPAALRDSNRLNNTMKAAVKASGATLLESAEYLFPSEGMTTVMLLSESHASIHTYPEYNSCFVDLFTCGQTCRAEKFDAVLRKYLKPGEVNSRILLRHREIEDDTSREFI